MDRYKIPDNRIVREASELGMRPGEFAAVVTIGGKHYQQCSVLRHAQTNEVISVEYRAAGGYYLDVLND
jgi:hypothetical protein